MRLLLCCLLALGPLLAEARVINVADHGIVPGKDVTYPLNRLIEEVRGEPDVTLRFPKGRYDFFPENAPERYRAIANHDNGLKRMAFPLFGHRNFTVDGGGSLFLFHGHVIPFVLEGVQGAVLKNFSIDWIRAFHAELKVVARDQAKKSAVFAIDPDRYPYRIVNGELKFQRYQLEDTIGSNIVFDPATRAPIYRTSDYAVREKRVRASEAGRNLIRLEDAFAVSPPPVGSVLIVYGTHPISRLCPAIHVTDSRAIKIENVVIHEAGGMGLIVERTTDIGLDRLVVTSNAERLVSTRADATHFVGCRGTIRVEHCVFEHMLDDGINVHGAYVPVVEPLGGNDFLCEISHFQQWGLSFAEPGDKIALLSRQTLLPFHETSVKAIRRLNEKRFVLTVASLPAQLPDSPLSVENLTWNPDLFMQHNIIRDHRARSVLVTTKGRVVIENNTFSSQMHGILIEGDNNKWYESGAVQDVTIRNNVFDNIGYEVTGRYPLYASPLFTAEQHLGATQYHRNIRFTGNTIRSFNGLVAYARSVKGLTISDNTIDLSPTYPRADEGAAIVLEYCADVRIEDNHARGFSPLAIARSADTANVHAARNSGFASFRDRADSAEPRSQ